MADGDAMQTDDAMDVVASKASASGLQIKLHPLVLVNIADHITKLRVQTSNPDPLVYGGLLGTQEGRAMTIANSFELICTPGVGPDPAIDMDYLRQRVEAVKAVMPAMELVGWYATGAAPTPTHLAIHNQIMQVNEAGVFLQLDLAPGPQGLELPRVYEPVTEDVRGQPRVVFARAVYQVETEEAEHIAVAHIAANATRDGDGGEGAGKSQLARQLISQYNAALMLHERTRVVLVYLRAVHKGELPLNHGILREIASLCGRLPLVNSHEFNKSFTMEYNDVLLSVLLAEMTGGCDKIEELATKVNKAYGDGLGGKSLRTGAIY